MDIANKIDRHEGNKNKQQNYYMLSNLDGLKEERGPLRPCGRIYFASYIFPTYSLPFPLCSGVSFRVPLLVEGISGSN
jgi:hypothetical protein